MILDTIMETKKVHLEQDLQDIVPSTPGTIATNIRNASDLFIIGEIKKASPSKGVILEDFDVTKLATAYEEAGIDALSVLSEKDFFQGHIDYIKQARTVFTKPILRKDFIMDVREIIQTKQIGSNIVLLIVAMLDDEQLRIFYQCAYALGLECIVEVHNERELTRALKLHPQIIGINNRNLQTFEVTLETTKRLIPLIPRDIAIVSESGIFTHNDIAYIKEAGAHGVLIGESFMRSTNFKQHLEELRYGKD